jgi:hypothetical protein
MYYLLSSKKSLSSFLDSTRFQKLFHPTALIGSTDPDPNAVKFVKINTSQRSLFVQKF